jgi:hypothetical protein
MVRGSLCSSWDMEFCVVDVGVTVFSVSWVRALRSFWACGVDLLLLVNTLRSFWACNFWLLLLRGCRTPCFFPSDSCLLGIICLSSLVRPGCVQGLSLLLFHGYVLFYGLILRIPYVLGPLLQGLSLFPSSSWGERYFATKCMLMNAFFRL